MQTDEEWLVVDTETSGLCSPIYVVEIAAQRMRGWWRDGEPFRVLLNHDVPIDPGAEAVHGYSREYLRQHGLEPREAHAQFYAYAGERPIVAYNLSYDWNRALVPEYERLGCSVSGRRGFCALTLSRRLFSDISDYKLETLKQHFALNNNRSHRGANDVETVCQLFENIMAPKLFAAGIVGFAAVEEFSRKTPIASCLSQIDGAGEAVWYYLDANNQTQGPYTAATLRSATGGSAFYVFREGMTDWTLSIEFPEFAQSATKKPRRKRLAKSESTSKQQKSCEASDEVHSVGSITTITEDYYEINLRQGTKEWLVWRRAGIGGSDAPTIMGENPWKSVDELRREKQGTSRGGRPNAAMARGTALEPVARARFIERCGVTVRPACLQSNRFDWLRASIDGISDDGNVLVEIKCGNSVYCRTMEEQRVPEYYYGQLQHTLAVTGGRSIQFFCYLPDRPEILLEVGRDDAYIERLLREERHFWETLFAP